MGDDSGGDWREAILAIFRDEPEAGEVMRELVGGAWPPQTPPPHRRDQYHAALRDLDIAIGQSDYAGALVHLKIGAQLVADE